ncbi:TonB-dependent receptor [Phenylobacterium sp. LjRoot219]|uniref:TonB-dependent receptor n=1 Tax=Phenylobacterium sp. LjRoot219 TaxID=3342283 RepID=UPI003ED0755B
MPSKWNKAALYLGSALTISLSAAAAQAQAQDGPAPASQPTVLGDVIVTARRVEERLQDVPISITVYNQQQIDQRNIVLPTDLATYTPSLSANQRFGPEKASFAIRGFNQEISTAPTVGVYFADVVGLRAQGGTTSGNTVGSGAFMDLQSVQVLKGPQGTLFGRNTTGGAILLVPNRPVDRFEGWVEGSAGNFDMKRFQGMLNLPFAEALRVRLSVDRNKREGYMRNHSGIGPDNYNDVNYFAARLGVLAEITPELENYTIGQYSNSFGRGFASKWVDCDRAAATQPYSIAAPFDNFGRAFGARVGCAQVDRQNARGDGLRDVEVNALDPKISLKQWQIINTTTWNVSENLTIKNIASYGEFRENSRFNLWSDNSFVPGDFPIPSGRGQPIQLTYLDFSDEGYTAAQKTYTEELQFQGNNFEDRLTWVIGGYLEFSRPLGWNSQTTSAFLDCDYPQRLNCANPLPGFGSYSLSRTQFDFDNHGVFAQGTYNFTDQFALTLGGRWTFDKIVAASESTRLQFNPLNGQFFRTCNDITRFFAINPATGARTNLPVTAPQQCHNEIKNKSDKPTWLINFDYKPTDDVLMYAKYARGYRQGGINLTNVGVETWDPEKVDSYEVGAKASYQGDISGFFNFAAFYNDFSGQQIFGGLSSKDQRIITGGAGIANVGKSRIWGIEIDATVIPLEGLRLDLGYTYLNTKVLDLTTPTLPPDSPFLAFTPAAAEGDPLPLSPKNRLTLTATYTLPLDEDVGKVYFGATYTHTDKQLANRDTPIYGTLPATDLLNLNANWDQVLDSPVDLALFVTNVTNEIYPVNLGGGWRTFGIADLLIGPPRMWGVRLRYSFGE